MYKTSLQIYRDLCRLVNHIGARTAKGEAMLNTIRTEFRKYKYVTDEKHIEELQENGRRALSNYLLSDSLTKMKKRGDVDENVQDGSQQEFKQVQFDVNELDKRIRFALGFGDQKSPSESKRARTNVADWAQADDEDSDIIVDEAEMIEGPTADPDKLAEAVIRFGDAYTPRNPEEGVLTAYFQTPPDDEKSNDESSAAGS